MRLGRNLSSKNGDEHVRKLQRTGEGGKSYTVNVPRELISELGWQKKQKVVIVREDKHLIIKDWKE